MKILVVYLFSVAIYNIEICAKMSLKMEYSNCNVNHKEESNEQISISCRFSLKKAKNNFNGALYNEENVTKWTVPNVTLYCESSTEICSKN
jgi:hypothetical protein